MKYKFVKDLTSDVLFESYGKNLEELFKNSALALFDIICNIEKVKPKKKITVSLTAPDEKKLLYNWLQELIAQVDIESLFFSKFKIIEISDKHLIAEVYGEPITKSKGRTVVKAVTNYKFSLEKSKKGYTAIVSVDI
jgi:SHS2 domain-containing protein